MGSSYAGAIHGCMEGLGRNVRRRAWLLPTCRNYLHNVMRMRCLEHSYRSRLLSHANVSQLFAQRHAHAVSRTQLPIQAVVSCQPVAIVYITS
jgi:hypothetical protein